MPTIVHPHQTHETLQRRPATRPASSGQRETSRNHTAPRPGKWLRRLHWYHEIQIAKIRAERNIPNVHLPKWRLRFAIAVRLFPILWILPTCQADGCQDHWPCKPLLRHLRTKHGWTGSIDHHIKTLSTKRRRRKANARNPTAVTHRAPRRNVKVSRLRR